MNNEKYLQEALRTESTDLIPIKARLLGSDSVRLLHAAQGLTTEAAEFMDALKKYIFYGKPLDKVNLIEELGDLFWYAAIACDVLGVTIDEVMDKNVKKLRQRYKNRFTAQEAIDRDPFHELAAMEKGAITIEVD